MKNLTITLLTALSSVFCEAGEDKVAEFLKNHPSSYQDIFVNNQTLRKGYNYCPVRYEMIKPVLDSFNRPFKVLDIGAAQGYFSLRIAHDYPEATCVMVEDNTSFHKDHGDMLYELCHLNDHLNNITYFKKQMDMPSLQLLTSLEHFDLVIAFLVIHQITESFEEQVAIVNQLLALGDTVIIEVANDVAVPLSEYVEKLADEIDGEYLGEVKRIPISTGIHYVKRMGKLFCFRSPVIQNIDQKIKSETFELFNGLYP